MADRIQYRRDTKQNWKTYNPLLLEGEVGFELDTNDRKIGDGIKKWNDLPYLSDVNNIYTKLNYQIALQSTTQKDKAYPLISVDKESKTISFIPNTPMYVIDNKGKEIVKTGEVDKEFTIRHNEVLIINLQTGLFEVLNNNDLRPMENILILSNMNGLISNGAILGLDNSLKQNSKASIAKGYGSINLNTETKELELNTISVICGKNIKNIKSAKVKLEVNNYDVYNIFFNASDSSFFVLPYLDVLPFNNYYFIGTGRTSTNELEIGTNFTIDGLDSNTFYSVNNKDLQLVFTSNKYPLITKENSSLNILIRSNIYILDANGKQLSMYKFDDIKYPKGQLLVVPNNNVLLYDLKKSEFYVTNNNTKRHGRYVLMASSHEGALMNGLFTSSLTETSNQNTPSYQVVWSNGSYPIINKVASTVFEVSIISNIYVLNKYGREIAKTDNITNKEDALKFTINHNEILLFDIDNNEYKVLSNNSNRPFRYVIILANSLGKILDGKICYSILNNHYKSLENIYDISASNYNYTMICGDKKHPILEITKGYELSIKFQSNLYFVNKFGKEICKWDEEINEQKTFLINHNDVLLFDKDTLSFNIQSNNSYRSPSKLLIAFNQKGQILDGLILPYLINENTESIKKLQSIGLDVDTIPMYNISFGLGEMPTIQEVNKTTLRVFFTQNMYVVNKTGEEIAVFKVKRGVNDSYLLKSNQVLLFDILNKEMLILENNDIRPSKYVLLLLNTYNKPIIGQLAPIYSNQPNNPTTSYSFPVTTEARYSVKDNNCESQGLTIIGSQMWHFKQSPDNNTSQAVIKRWNIEDFSNVSYNIHHNLGHAASADYNQSNNTLAVGNGTYLTEVLPRLDLVLNADKFTKEENSFIDINSKDVLSIPFFTDKKQIGGSGLICCWGETERHIYLLTGQHTPRMIFRVELGVGKSDLSDKTPNKTDDKHWGTFNPNAGENEFNGTAKVLSVHKGVETGVYQGCTFRDGYIWLCCGYSVPIVYKIKCYEDGSYKIHDMIKIQIWDDNGKIASYEPEGVCIDNHYMYMGLVGSDRKLIAVPIYNRQGGVAYSDDIVKFDFKVNHNPNIQLTPLSDVTDIYISELTNTHFIVKSKSGLKAKFNWTACI